MKAETLEGLGFTAGEARVYIALLELGETTTGAIIDRSKISGSKVYGILNRLMEKGLASYIMREKTKYFQAAQPNRLLDYVERKEAELAEQKRTVETILPSLEKLRAATETAQSAQIYEGYEGMRTVFNLILETVPAGGEYHVFFLGSELGDRKLVEFIKSHHRRRIKRGVRVKLMGDAASRQFFKPFAGIEGWEVRFYPQPLPLGVYIFADYVATLSFGEKPTVFLIKSRGIAEAYRNFFIGLWKKSKKG